MSSPAPTNSPDGHPDLEVLRRTEPAWPSPRGRTPTWLPRLTIALLVLGGLYALWALLSPALFPPREVRLAAVRTADAGEARRSAVTEAAGWIEADPFPAIVRPLVPGVVSSLRVLEGQAVEKGETIVATLENAELENALELAAATLVLREAELRVAQAMLATDRALLEQRLDLRELRARRSGELAAARAAAEAAEARENGAKAAWETSRLDLEALENLEGAGSSAPLARARARARVQEAAAEVGAAVASKAQARADVDRLEALVELAEEGVDEPRALAGEVREDVENVTRAEASRDLAQTGLKVAQRNVDLLTVKAPVNGIVLRLESAPGASAGPEGDTPRGSSEEGTGSTGRLGVMGGALVSLYDPERLQARVDVQLDDVQGIGVGTEVEIEVAALPGRVFRGVVSRLQREADILKNTLQVKVRLLEPDPLLRPEMLVRARFLVERETETTGRSPTVRALVPSEALDGDALFVYDPRAGGRARRLAVKVLGEQDGVTEVEGAIGPGHKVILDPVRDGEKVRGVE